MARILPAVIHVHQVSCYSISNHYLILFSLDADGGHEPRCGVSTGLAGGNLPRWLREHNPRRWLASLFLAPATRRRATRLQHTVGQGQVAVRLAPNARRAA